MPEIVPVTVSAGGATTSSSSSAFLVSFVNPFSISLSPALFALSNSFFVIYFTLPLIKLAA